MSTTTPGAARPEPLKVLDAASKNGGDSVSPSVRSAAAVNTPEANTAIQRMTADNGSTMNPFIGKNGDCTIGNSAFAKDAPSGKDAPSADKQTSPDSTHTVSGSIHRETTV